MKYFVALSAVILAASAMPTEIGKEAAFNSTRNIPWGQAGFAAVGSGTTGGAGGAIWTVWDGWALRDAVAGNAHRIIHIHGFIDLFPLFTGSPGVSLVVGNHKTIVGIGNGATIYGGGLKFFGGTQIIVQNIKFHNALSFAPGEQPNGSGGIIGQVAGAWSQVDAIDVDMTTYVWIDHCEFADNPWIASNVPDNQRRHDGLVDIKRGSNWISISNSIFHNHNLVSLIGHDDSNGWEDVGKLKVTFYNNWFMGTVQRNPRVRYGEVHILNNLYTDVTSYGIGIGAGASVYAERNVFMNTRRAWGWASGVPNPIGYLLNLNNLLVNSGTDSGITGGSVNWTPSQYYHYNPMANTAVEWHVRTYAGVR